LAGSGAQCRSRAATEEAVLRSVSYVRKSTIAGVHTAVLTVKLDCPSCDNAKSSDRIDALIAGVQEMPVIDGKACAGSRKRPFFDGEGQRAVRGRSRKKAMLSCSRLAA